MREKFFERRKLKVIEVCVTVNYKDRNYQTNVIVSKDTVWTKIKQLAEEQVKKSGIFKYDYQKNEVIG
ncbi:molecular chaperone [Bacillus anthracis]|uniref:Uncharacterized protein n=2 Tax=Bacillus anthracis TaxID=1392 RepID=A0A384KXN0_BACAN|nr:BA3454 family stress response protein [Bacillus anthracis]AAP27224.1 hypothetical protein BA_3455 [Bacillus anthracis str. Ames]AAT32563.1 hypothetical protein GBAA_3455 [Bacillus anthracis str. 'Ames Ancestor']AAT55509.1 hypothetical protein BAS3201 [Bacillus anthracis str. Sterne]EXJ19144.1 molecular chaperone [Bacillus anthracis str. 95014]AMC05280.1 molecular chaperone [Bacillus anthracis]